MFLVPGNVMGIGGAELPVRTQTAAGDRYVHRSLLCQVRTKTRALCASGRARERSSRGARGMSEKGF